MTSELMNHLWQSTLFAVAVALLALAFRKDRAQVRYWLWFSASIKFLIPFALLISLGGRLEWAPAVRKVFALPILFAAAQIAHPFPGALQQIPFTREAREWALIAILGVWACGFAWVTLIRFRGWLRIREAIRFSVPSGLPATVDVRLSSGLLEPGVAGLWRPLVLLPRGIAEHLTPPQLEAVLAHELCHVRRRDNLFAAIHMVVEAMFWFLPRVWWIGSRLVEERERACDEEVLSMGNEPQIYAEGILNVCRLCVKAPLPCASGITGSDLRTRIEAILAGRAMGDLHFAKKIALTVAAIASLVLPILAGMMSAPTVRAQDAAGPKFEVASVRPSNPNARGNGFKGKSGRGGSGSGFQVEHTRFTATNMSVFGIILRAYDVKGCRPLGAGNCVFVSGGPDWLKTQSFDIQAKMPDDSPNYTSLQFLNGQAPQLQRMLQALLIDRFKLRIHRVNKQLPVFELKIGRKGPKLTRVDRTERPLLVFHPLAQQNGEEMMQLIAKNSSMQDLCDLYSRFMPRPVLDRTGLQGTFDFTVTYAADPDAPDLPGAELAGPALFTAFQEQAGLKFESTKDSVEILVIDYAERPSEN